MENFCKFEVKLVVGKSTHLYKFCRLENAEGFAKTLLGEHLYNSELTCLTILNAITKLEVVIYA